MTDRAEFNGVKLKEARKSRGYTYQELADLTDSSKSYMFELEKGTIEPSGHKLIRISAALGIEPSEFYNTKPLPNSEMLALAIQLINKVRAS